MFAANGMRAIALLLEWKLITRQRSCKKYFSITRTLCNYQSPRWRRGQGTQACVAPLQCSALWEISMLKSRENSPNQTAGSKKWASAGARWRKRSGKIDGEKDSKSIDARETKRKWNEVLKERVTKKPSAVCGIHRKAGKELSSKQGNCWSRWSYHKRYNILHMSVQCKLMLSPGIGYQLKSF